MFIFFFQAEDGIRDGHVTGVQTCALPISPMNTVPSSSIEMSAPVSSWIWLIILPLGPMTSPILSTGTLTVMIRGAVEIGRASCRERVRRSMRGGQSQEVKISENRNDEEND